VTVLRRDPHGVKTARFAVRCSSRCTGTARLATGRATARRLHRRTLAAMQLTLRADGQRIYKLAPSRAVRRAMRRAAIHTVKVQLRVTLVDAARARTVAEATVRLRR
jgi:hypothetical protein